MGLLRRALTPKPLKRVVRVVTNPVGAAKRAVTPRPVKKMKRLVFPVVHPIHAVERSVEDTLLGLGRAGRKRRGKKAQSPAPKDDRREGGRTAAKAPAGFDLPFTLVQCETCGVARPAGIACSRCGSLTVYSDPAIERRRRVVEPLLNSLFDERTKEALAQDTLGAPQIALSDVFDAVGTWVESFPGVLSQIQDGPENEARGSLEVSVGIFHQLCIRVSAIARSQPDDLEVWAWAERQVWGLHWATCHYLRAMTTVDPERCQAEVAAAQRSIDFAASAARQTRIAAGEAGIPPI
jgi:hypothetical protein